MYHRYLYEYKKKTLNYLRILFDSANLILSSHVTSRERKKRLIFTLNLL